MKEDYLWNKTGEDPEIERLENALAVFRYQATAPPALPAKIVPFERKTPRGIFRLWLTFTACAALVIVSLVVWFQFSGKKIEVAKDSTETNAPPIVEEFSGETPIEKPADLIAKKMEAQRPSAAPKIVTVRKPVPAIARQNKTIARRAEAKKPVLNLSKDEKYAYNQLMLALSITGSKLKLVTDKIERVEETNIVR